MIRRKPTFKVRHYNFGNVREFAVYADALEFVKRTNFEAAIYQCGKRERRIATYSPITGFKEENRK